MNKPVGFPQTREDFIWYALNDPKYIIERAFYIVNKQGQLVPFIFNESQNDFYYNRTWRDDILKGSQFGISSVILAILTVRFAIIPYRWSVSISHDEGSTKRLFMKPKSYLETAEPWFKKFVKLEIDNNDTLKNQLTNSLFYIGTAGAKSFGRGDTIHDAHMSEVSRWRNASDIVTTIMRAMPSEKTTWAVKETTANGQGNFHHIEWENAKAGKSSFHNIFLAWFNHTEYRIAGANLEGEYDETEKHLMTRHPEIGDEQLAWRRQKIKDLPPSDKGYTPEQMFMQEFPSDDKEAFLFSGNPFFAQLSVEEYVDRLAKVKKPVRGNLVGVAPHHNFDETEKGYIKRWAEPEKDGQYVIFGDVATSGDYSSGTVVNKRTWKIVATWHGHINAARFGDELVRLGYYYNTALLAIEANNMGQSTVDRVVEVGYPNIYMREDLNKKDSTGKPKREYGWWTDLRSRPLMLGYFQGLVRDLYLEEIPDEELLNEMRTFINTDSGKPEASEGNKDDRVISASGAYYILKLHPYIEKVTSAATNKVRRQVQNFKSLRGAKKRV